MTEAGISKSIPSDRIFIKDLVVRCIVGIRDEERREKQDVVINIVMWTDLKRAGHSDSVFDTIDYSAIKKRVLSMVEESNFFLVEALAEKIAEICLEDARVRRVLVAVEKPSALRFARSVGVEIVRDQA